MRLCWIQLLQSVGGETEAGNPNQNDLVEQGFEFLATKTTIEEGGPPCMLSPEKEAERGSTSPTPSEASPGQGEQVVGPRSEMDVKQAAGAPLPEGVPSITVGGRYAVTKKHIYKT